MNAYLQVDYDHDRRESDADAMVHRAEPGKQVFINEFAKTGYIESIQKDSRELFVMLDGEEETNAMLESVAKRDFSSDEVVRWLEIVADQIDAWGLEAAIKNLSK